MVVVGGGAHVIDSLPLLLFLFCAPGAVNGSAYVQLDLSGECCCRWGSRKHVHISCPCYCHCVVAADCAWCSQHEPDARELPPETCCSCHCCCCCCCCFCCRCCCCCYYCCCYHNSCCCCLLTYCRYPMAFKYKKRTYRSASFMTNIGDPGTSTWTCIRRQTFHIVLLYTVKWIIIY